jgi:hypothetical protein
VFLFVDIFCFCFYFVCSFSQNQIPVGVKVPMYSLMTAKDGEFVLTVHQQDERCEGAKPYIDLGVTIMQETEVPGTYVLCGMGDT